MQISYCDNCEKHTGHKRAIGAGTIIGAVATGGFSLLATPFYPPRCIVCGNATTRLAIAADRGWLSGGRISPPEDSAPDFLPLFRLIFYAAVGYVLLLL